MNGLRRRLVAALVTSGVLTVGIAGIGGCSGHDDPSPAEAPEGRDAGSPAAAAGHRDGDEPEILPFDELLGLGGDAQELADRWAEWSAGYPDAVTACMTGRGWRDFVEPVEPIPTLDELERSRASSGTATDGLRDHGYGITGNLRIQVDNAITDRAATEDEIPAWRTALSPAEREALEHDEESCRGAALERFPHPMGGGRDPQAAQAYFELAEVRLSLEQAPEVRAVWAEWSTCMRDHGWSADRRSDLVEELTARADPVVVALQEAQRSDGTVLRSDHPAVVAARRAADELEEREDRMVADDVTCAERVDLDRRSFAALRRVQSRYLAEHGAEVRRLVVAAGLSR